MNRRNLFVIVGGAALVAIGTYVLDFREYIAAFNRDSMVTETPGNPNDADYESQS
jgi:hypothetical protein